MHQQGRYERHTGSAGPIHQVTRITAATARMRPSVRAAGNWIVCMARYCIAVAVLCACWATPASGQVWSSTYIASNFEAGSATTIATGPISGAVGSGDFVVVCVGNESGISISGVSDGTSSLTPLTQRSDGTRVVRMFYILSSVATGGAVNYTATFASAASVRYIYAVSYATTSGTHTYQGQENGGTGNSTTLSSGNITPVGSSDALSIGCGLVAGGIALANHQINGTAASGAVSTGSMGTGLNLWSLENHSGFTGAATATLASNFWVGLVSAFRSATTSTSCGGLSLLGVGC